MEKLLGKTEYIWVRDCCSQPFYPFEDDEVSERVLMKPIAGLILIQAHGGELRLQQMCQGGTGEKFEGLEPRPTRIGGTAASV